MDAVLDDISISLYNGTLPREWSKLAPPTRKNLAGWMDHFEKRIDQYTNWVSKARFLFNLGRQFNLYKNIILGWF